MPSIGFYLIRILFFEKVIWFHFMVLVFYIKSFPLPFPLLFFLLWPGVTQAFSVVCWGYPSGCGAHTEVHIRAHTLVVILRHIFIRGCTHITVLFSCPSHRAYQGPHTLVSGSTQYVEETHYSARGANSRSARNHTLPVSSREPNSWPHDLQGHYFSHWVILQLPYLLWFWLAVMILTSWVRDLLNHNTYLGEVPVDIHVRWSSSPWKLYGQGDTVSQMWLWWRGGLKRLHAFPRVTQFPGADPEFGAGQLASLCSSYPGDFIQGLEDFCLVSLVSGCSVSFALPLSEGSFLTKPLLHSAPLQSSDWQSLSPFGLGRPITGVLMITRLQMRPEGLISTFKTA